MLFSDNGLRALRMKVDELNRKAKRLNVPPLEVVILGEEGKSYKIDATVKKHEDGKYGKSTIINRVKYDRN